MTLAGDVLGVALPLFESGPEPVPPPQERLTAIVITIALEFAILSRLFILASSTCLLYVSASLILSGVQQMYEVGLL